MATRHPALLYDDPTWMFKYRHGRAEAYSNLIPRRDRWYHIVVAIDRWNQGRLFVNGSLESEFTATARASTTSGLFQIGAD